MNLHQSLDGSVPFHDGHYDSHAFIIHNSGTHKPTWRKYNGNLCCTGVTITNITVVYDTKFTYKVQIKVCSLISCILLSLQLSIK